MQTTATNRRIRQILTAVQNETLIPDPAFQRRLVWKNRDKCNFIKTVLDGYPFPEIYVAAGSVDLETGEGSEMLVDGQQRVSTLLQYFTGADELKLERSMTPYKDLPGNKKEAFLQYDVVVRDLGTLPPEEIREVFQRINSTSYSLNAMEIHNSRYDGEFKVSAEYIAALEFFLQHKIFSVDEIRRMRDTLFILGFMVTVLSNYFHRNSQIESYLEIYNEEFPHGETMVPGVKRVLSFIEECAFEPTERVWKHADIFTILVEIYWALVKDGLDLDARAVGENLKAFYGSVDALPPEALNADTDFAKYQRASVVGTNDRSNRILRGGIISEILRG